jgi:dTDP-4-dehydrorhamnose reductase
MQLLVIGSNGQLGSDMVALAHEDGHQVSALDYPDIDIRDEGAIERSIKSTGAQAIINCAAYTAVDKCESERDAATALNATAPGLLARQAKRAGARLVHISTDYVFDGRATTPYTEADEPRPNSVYGQTKRAGEQQVALHCEHHLIVRIAWLYGANGSNFVKTILRAAQAAKASGTPLRVVNDQIGSPTCTLDVCRQILALLKSPHHGIFHCTAEGQCSWYDFTRLILQQAGLDTELLACTTAEFPRPAPRPAFSVLENSRLKQLGLNLMPAWDSGYKEFFKHYGARLLANKDSNQS